MNISNEKMTFLTANYGLTPDQITRFYEGYCEAYQSMAGEIEYTWQEGGWYPDDEYAAMVECLCDADRLEQFIHRRPTPTPLDLLERVARHSPWLGP